MAIAFVGQAGPNLFTLASFTIPTTDITWGTPVAGHTLILALQGTSGGATSVTSSDGTWTKLGSTTASDGYLNEVWICPNIAGGKNAISVHVSSAGNCETWLAEFSGLDTSGALDGAVVTNNGSGTSVSASTTTTNASDLLLLFGTYDSSSGNNFISSNPAGWTATNINGDYSWGLGNAIYYQIESATGTYSPSFSIHTGTGWNTLLVALKGASSSFAGSKTQTATARIQATPTFTQSALARIQATVTKTQSALARVQSVVTKTQPATGRIQVTSNLTQTAIARISKLFSTSIDAVARIQATASKTQTAVARISIVGTKTQTAIARIVLVFTKTQPATARIQATPTQTQPATARISKTLTFTQTATAHIVINSAPVVNPFDTNPNADGIDGGVDDGVSTDPTMKKFGRQGGSLSA